MKKTGNIIKQKLDKICINCNFFFPYLEHGASEYGLCLKDNEFEPYVDELLEKQNYNCCRELIGEKKFDGNREPCKEFDMIEEIEDYTSVSGLSGNELYEEKEIPDFGLVLKNQSIERFKKEVNSPNINVRLAAFESLSALTGFKNNEAAELLIESFNNIPAPSSLDEVHFKLNVFRFVNRYEFIEELIPSLVQDLCNTKSNNKTRQWILEIFRFFSIYKENEKIKNSLEKILSEKLFSYRIKKKIKGILYEADDFPF